MANQHTARPAIERVVDRLVLTEEGCWLWEGRLNNSGYGEITLNKTVDGVRRTTLCHRLTYTYFRGPIPERLQIDHLCRVRHCVNPWHCEPVSHRENQLRGEAPRVRLHRENVCMRGHSLIEYGVRSGTRRRCRLCHNERARERRAVARSTQREVESSNKGMRTSDSQS